VAEIHQPRLWTISTDIICAGWLFIFSQNSMIERPCIGRFKVSQECKLCSDDQKADLSDKKKKPPMKVLCIEIDCTHQTMIRSHGAPLLIQSDGLSIWFEDAVSQGPLLKNTQAKVPCL